MFFVGDYLKGNISIKLTKSRTPNIFDESQIIYLSPWICRLTAFILDRERKDGWLKKLFGGKGENATKTFSGLFHMNLHEKTYECCDHGFLDNTDVIL